MTSAMPLSRSRTTVMDSPRAAFSAEGTKSTRRARWPASAPATRRSISNAASLPASTGSRSSVAAARTVGGASTGSSRSSASSSSVGGEETAVPLASSRTRVSISRRPKRRVSTPAAGSWPPLRSDARSTDSIRCAMATTGSTPTIAESPLMVWSARKSSRTARGLASAPAAETSIFSSVPFAASSCSPTSAR